MIVSHKITLNVTKAQAEHLEKCVQVARFTYNWALSEYKTQLELFKASGNSEDKPNILKLKKYFNSIKREQFPFVLEVTKCASEQPFANIQKAFSSFFKKNARFPNFHKRDLHNSFYISNDKFKISEKTVSLPKLGKVKLRETLKFAGKVMSATVSKKANKWFISVAVDISENRAQFNLDVKDSLNREIKVVDFNTNKSDSIGVDLGIKTAIHTSDNEKIYSPKALKRYLKKLKRLQQSLSRKTKGSNNRNKAKVKLSKVYCRISNIRKDWIHKVTKYLCSNYKLIALEDLHTKGMMRNRHLAKAISDIGFGMFREILTYKAVRFNGIVHIINRFLPSSKKCSNCNYVKKELKLSERVFICENCNNTLDRDYNASINILNYSTQSH